MANEEMMNQTEEVAEEEKHVAPYHLLVTDNKTGEVEFDIDFDAMIGATVEKNKDGNGCHGICITEATAGQIAMGIETVQKVIDDLMKKDRIKKTVEIRRLMNIFGGGNEEEAKDD